MTTVTAELDLPAEFKEKFWAYIRREPSGSVTLHFKDGKIMAWELKETGRVC